MKKGIVRSRSLPLLLSCVMALTGAVGSYGSASAAVNVLDTTYSVDALGETSGAGFTGFALASGSKFNAGKGIAVQKDQMIVAVGTVISSNGDTDGAVIRYDATGKIDSTFNSNKGYFAYGGPGADKLNAVAIDSLDRIVVVGTFANDPTGNDVWVMRLNPDGTLDKTFGAPKTGEIVLPSPGNDSGNAVTIDQTNNKIIIAGTLGTGTGMSSAWVIRLKSDGTLDESFNALSTDPGSIAVTGSTDPDGIHTANGVYLDPANGNIFVTGSKSLDVAGNGFSAMWVLKLTSVGELDNNFGTFGEVALGSTGTHTGNAVAVDASGKIVVVGTYDWANTPNSAQAKDIWVQRLNANGSIDQTFFVNGNTGGSSFGGAGNDTGNAVAIQDGMIIVVGTLNAGTASSSVWVARLKDNGQPSNTFNNGQAFYTATGTGLGGFSGNAVALQSDKKIVIAGSGYDDATGTATVMTLRLNGAARLLAVDVVGGGTVSATPGTLLFNNGLNAYVENYYPETVVTLSASPTTGWLFSGWNYPGCSAPTDCVVTMTNSENVTATFVRARLTVTTPGLGTGTVISNPQGFSGINCDSSDPFATGCSSLFPANSSVSLSVASTAWYSIFKGWTGACSATGACSVPMDQILTTVGADFDLIYRVKLLRPNDTTDMFYPIIRSDYQAALTHNEQAATILVHAYAFPENLDYNMPIALTFNGGTDTSFNNPGTGYTTVQGLKIKNGRMNVAYLKIK